jgi:predicted glycosyltransferase
VLGRHGGARRSAKARAALDRVAAMVRFGRGRGLHRGLAHGSTDLPAACRLLGVRCTTMLDYEWAMAQHHVGCRLATRVLAPDAIPVARLARYGARPPKLVRYPGLKEEYYLNGFEPDPRVLDKLGVERGHILSVVRTAPAYALYLGGRESGLIPALLRRLDARADVRTVVLPRTPEQAEALSGLGSARTVVARRAVDGRSLVALADLLVSAGGTMNREAAVLGTPVWSIFEGRLGAVDEQLAREGRLRFLSDPDELEIAPKDGRGVKTATRDPADLLALALPGA